MTCTAVSDRECVERLPIAFVSGFRLFRHHVAAGGASAFASTTCFVRLRLKNNTQIHSIHSILRSFDCKMASRSHPHVRLGAPWWPQPSPSLAPARRPRRSNRARFFAAACLEDSKASGGAPTHTPWRFVHASSRERFKIHSRARASRYTHARAPWGSCLAPLRTTTHPSLHTKRASNTAALCLKPKTPRQQRRRAFVGGRAKGRSCTFARASSRRFACKSDCRALFRTLTPTSTLVKE